VSRRSGGTPPVVQRRHAFCQYARVPAWHRCAHALTRAPGAAVAAGAVDARPHPYPNLILTQCAAATSGARAQGQEVDRAIVGQCTVSLTPQHNALISPRWPAALQLLAAERAHAAKPSVGPTRALTSQRPAPWHDGDLACPPARYCLCKCIDVLGVGPGVCKLPRACALQVTLGSHELYSLVAHLATAGAQSACTMGQTFMLCGAGRRRGSPGRRLREWPAAGWPRARRRLPRRPRTARRPGRPRRPRRPRLVRAGPRRGETPARESDQSGAPCPR
jgi:hypothetical protein